MIQPPCCFVQFSGMKTDKNHVSAGLTFKCLWDWGLKDKKLSLKYWKNEKTALMQCVKGTKQTGESISILLILLPREQELRNTRGSRREKEGKKKNVDRLQEKRKIKNPECVNPLWVAIRGCKKARSGNRGALPSPSIHIDASILLYITAWRCALYLILCTHLSCAFCHNTSSVNMHGLQTDIIIGLTWMLRSIEALADVIIIDVHISIQMPLFFLLKRKKLHRLHRKRI